MLGSGLLSLLELFLNSLQMNAAAEVLICLLSGLNSCLSPGVMYTGTTMLGSVH